MEAPQKVKNSTTLQYSNSTSGYLSKENESTNSERYMNSYVHCIVIYNSQDVEATQVSTDGGIDKEDVVRVCMYVRI